MAYIYNHYLDLKPSSSSNKKIERLKKIRKFQKGGSLPGVSLIDNDDLDLFMRAKRRINYFTSDITPEDADIDYKQVSLVPRDTEVKIDNTRTIQKPVIKMEEKEVTPLIDNNKYGFLAKMKKIEYPFDDQALFDKAVDYTVLREMGGKKDASALKKFNRLGYVGAFQFGADALKSLKYLKKGKLEGKTQKEQILNENNWIGGKKARDNFLTSFDEQKKAFKELTKRNFRSIISALKSEGISDPMEIASYVIAAHLSGPTNIRRYIVNKGKSDFKDANGTTIDHYKKGFLEYLNK